MREREKGEREKRRKKRGKEEGKKEEGEGGGRLQGRRREGRSVTMLYIYFHFHPLLQAVLWPRQLRTESWQPSV
jgi:hypothetical protein